MNRYLIFIPLLILICLLGCNNPLSLESQHPIQIKTNKDDYNLKKDDSVKVTITNKSSETIYYSTCFAKTIEVVKSNKVVKKLGTPVCYCLCPAELKPGESVPAHLSSVSAEIFKSRLENSVNDKSAGYRIQYSFYYDEAFGDEPIPPEYSRSNTFKISEN